MQNFRHNAQNAGHTIQNERPTMQNVSRTMHNVGCNTLNVCQGPRGFRCPQGSPYPYTYNIKTLVPRNDLRTLGTKINK